MPLFGSTTSRYRLIERVATGSHGTVWSAEDRLTHQRVAVKVAPDRPSAEIEHRFLQERRFRFDHPNVLGVIDTYDVRGRLGFVMPYADLADLTTRVEQDGALSPQHCLDAAAELLRALGYIHGQQVVHRDVKPSNVLFRTVGERPIASLADFGSAVDLRGPRLTTTHHPVGTVGFMAPEVEAGRDATEASDLYSLGRTLEFALTGSAATPVDRESLDEPLRSLLGGLLERNPAHRTPDAASALALIGADIEAPRGPSGFAPSAPRPDDVPDAAGPGPRPGRRWLAVAVAGALTIGVLGFGAGRCSAPDAEKLGDDLLVSSPRGDERDALDELVALIEQAYAMADSEEPIVLRSAFTRLVARGGAGFVASGTDPPTLVPARMEVRASTGFEASGDAVDLEIHAPATNPWESQITLAESAESIVGTSRKELEGQLGPLLEMGNFNGALDIGIITMADSSDQREVVRSLVAGPHSTIAVQDPNAPITVDVLIDLRSVDTDAAQLPPGSSIPALQLVVDEPALEFETFSADYARFVTDAARELGRPHFLTDVTALPLVWKVEGLLPTSSTPTPIALVGALSHAVERRLGDPTTVRVMTSSGGQPADGWSAWPPPEPPVGGTRRAAQLVVAHVAPELAGEVRTWTARSHPEARLVFLDI